MNSQFLIEKLESSDDYKKFIEENPKAYLCSGFFDIDVNNTSENKYHFDFFIPSKKKTFSFELETGKIAELERNYEEKILDRVLLKKNFDFYKIEEKIAIEMELQRVKNKIQKMIFSLQNFEGKDTLFGTILISGLALIKMTFDISENKIEEFEKKSFFDMMKIVKK